MDDETLARMLAAGRSGVGLALLAVPGLVAGIWVGRDARSSGTRVVARALGARELALGLGTLRALGGQGDVRTWAGAGVIADAVDFAITLTASDIPALGRLGVLGAAATGTAVGVRTLQRLGSAS